MTTRTPARWTPARWALAAALLCTTGASADAIPEGGWRTPDCPPQTCPPGTIPYGGSHGGCSPGCAPNGTCTDDAACVTQYGEGARCAETRFCLQDQYPGNSHVVVVRGVCGEGDTCEEPSSEYEEAPRCDVSRRCIAAPRPPPSMAATSGTPTAPPSMASSGTSAETNAPAATRTSATREDEGSCRAGGTGDGALAWLVLALVWVRKNRRGRACGG